MNGSKSTQNGTRVVSCVICDHSAQLVEQVSVALPGGHFDYLCRGCWDSLSYYAALGVMAEAQGYSLSIETVKGRDLS